MKLGNSILAVLTVGLVAAAPVESDAGPSDGDIQLDEVIFPGILEFTDTFANGGYFWTDKPTASECNKPSEGFECISDEKNRTILYGISKGSLALASSSTFVNPKGMKRKFVYLDGQRLFIAPDGALSYTKSKQLYVPKGSTVDGWKFEYGALSNNGALPYACPEGKHHKIYFNNVDLPKNCKYHAIVPASVLATDKYL